MFKMVQTATYMWPVRVQMPVDGGRFEESTFDAQFKRLNLDEIKALENTDETGEAQCKALLVGWKGVVDDSGEEVPFSEHARNQLLQWPTVRAALLHAWRDSVAGARRKN